MSLRLGLHRFLLVRQSLPTVPLYLRVVWFRDVLVAFLGLQFLAVGVTELAGRFARDGDELIGVIGTGGVDFLTFVALLGEAFLERFVFQVEVEASLGVAVERQVVAAVALEEYRGVTLESWFFLNSWADIREHWSFRVTCFSLW